MRPQVPSCAGILAAATCAAALPGPSFVRRAQDFSAGHPSDGEGRGAPILGGTNRFIDEQNPDNLGRQSTDHGTVPNLKWRFSDSKTDVHYGGWLRSQVKNDLPQSTDVSATQVHLSGGAIRESHWHSVAEWGFVFDGSILISTVDEHGRFQVEELGFGDVWYFPKGTAHTIQGLDDESELLLVFDQPNFEDVGITFEVDDWISHTPKSTLAKNFNVNATLFDSRNASDPAHLSSSEFDDGNASIFDSVPDPNPVILNGTVTNSTDVSGGGGELTDNGESFVFRTLDHDAEPVPGGGGTFRKIDSTVFPVSRTIAATFMTLEPGGLRELHWHPNAAEWLFFHSGEARATVFIGDQNHRTFDFHAGDTAVFPDNSGHYIENIGDEDLVWIEIYKSERVADISLTQWLALTPADLVAQTLKVPVSFVLGLKKEKQVSLAG